MGSRGHAVQKRSAEQVRRSRYVSAGRCRPGEIELVLAPVGPPPAPAATVQVVVTRRDAGSPATVEARVEQRGRRRRSAALGPMRRCGFVRMPVALVTEAYAAALTGRGRTP